MGSGTRIRFKEQDLEAKQEILGGKKSRKIFKEIDISFFCAVADF
jgi:hypothetical protein